MEMAIVGMRLAVACGRTSLVASTKLKMRLQAPVTRSAQLRPARSLASVHHQK